MPSPTVARREAEEAAERGAGEEGVPVAGGGAEAGLLGAGEGEEDLGGDVVREARD